MNLEGIFMLLLLSLFNRTLVREVCTNHEVTKPQIGTYLNLGSVTYLYGAILYAPLCLLSFAA